MKSVRFGVISILVLIVVLLVGYIVVSNNTALLRVSLNYLLHKYNVAAEFSNINFKGKSEISVRNFSVHRKGLTFKASFLSVKLSSSGKLDVVIEDPTVVLKLDKGGVSKKNSIAGLISIIGSARIDNMRMVVVRGGKRILVVDHGYIGISNGNLGFSGEVQYRANGNNLYAFIKQARGNFKVGRKVLLVKSLVITPKVIRLDYGNTVVLIRKDLKIENVMVGLNPIRLKGISVNVRPYVSMGGSSGFVFDGKLHVGLGKGVVFSGTVEHLRSKFAVIKYVNFSGHYNQGFNVSGNFSGASVDYDGFMSDGMGGLFSIKNRGVFLRVVKGEIAYGLWYNDFSKNGFYVHANLSRDVAFKLGLGNLLKVSGLYSKSGLLSFRMESADVNKLFDISVRSPFEDDYPFLGKVSLSGNVAVGGTYDMHDKTLRLSASGDWGRVLLGKVDFEGFTFEVPVFLGVPGRGMGFIRIDKIELPCCSFPIKAQIVSFMNGFEVKFNKINMGGIVVSLDRFRIKTHPFHIRCTAMVRGKIKGVRVYGEFERIAGNSERITFDGFVVLHVFSGVVRIKHIVLYRPFGFPLSAGMDVYFSHINLSEVTRKTNFGLVTGYVKGYVKHLVLVGDQPQSFDMLVRTQNVSGVKKVIAVRAINNLARISGGYAALAVPFFKTLPYSWIGFKCSLKNDVFVIHGLEREGNKEYIVKKGFLIGVNVLVDRRGNRILWSDMISRIKRITSGG